MRADHKDKKGDGRHDPGQPNHIILKLFHLSFLEVKALVILEIFGMNIGTSFL
jgi:hypothetical protein